jgi:tellurite resistance protein
VSATALREAAGAVPAASLAHLPLPLFAAPMGLGGLALAWRQAGHAFGLPAAIGEAVAAIALAVLTLVAGAYAAKALRHPGSVRADLAHPIRAVFASAATVALVIGAILVLPWSRPVAAALLAVGAAAHLVVAVALLARWIARPTEIAHAAPTWLIPLVGNIIVPLGAVPLGWTEPAWLFFGVGAGLWLLVTPILLNRLIFHPDLPPRLMPSLAVLIAPPAVAMLSWLTLTGGALDPMARMLFGLAVVFALALAALAPRLARLPFFVSWWAYTFPLAAFTIATATYATAIGGVAASAVALALLALTTAVVGLVALRSLAALASGALLAPD